MVKELEVVTEERDSYKEKNSAARARNKILTQDVKNFKEQISTLVDKGKHDDELVSALLVSLMDCLIWVVLSESTFTD